MRSSRRLTVRSSETTSLLLLSEKLSNHSLRTGRSARNLTVGSTVNWSTEICRNGTRRQASNRFSSDLVTHELVQLKHSNESEDNVPAKVKHTTEKLTDLWIVEFHKRWLGIQSNVKVCLTWKVSFLLNLEKMSVCLRQLMKFVTSWSSHLYLLHVNRSNQQHQWTSLHIRSYRLQDVCFQSE